MRYYILSGIWLLCLLVSGLAWGKKLARKHKNFKAYSLLPLNTDSIVHRERLLELDRQILASSEDSILQALQIVQSLDTSLGYAYKLSAIKRVLWHMRNALLCRHSFAYDFAKLQNNISLIYPKDSSFRIFTWQYSIEDLVAIKQGLIQMNTLDGSPKIYPLIDRTAQIQAPLDTLTTAQAWIGAMYYYIHSEDIGRRRIYTLLGIDEHNILSTRKWIEILRFSKDGVPYFGGPFFSQTEISKKQESKEKRANNLILHKPTNQKKAIKYKLLYKNKKAKKQDLDLIPIPSALLNPKPLVEAKPLHPKIYKRFMLEYMKSTVVNLRYDKDLQMIIFDHLQPSDDATSERKYTYDIDGDYEGFVWRKDRWVHIPNVFDFQLEGGKVPRDKPVNFRKQMKEYEKIMRNR